MSVLAKLFLVAAGLFIFFGVWWPSLILVPLSAWAALVSVRLWMEEK